MPKLTPLKKLMRPDIRCLVAFSFHFRDKISNFRLFL